MKKNIVAYFIIAYVMNTVFLFIYSLMAGKVDAVNFLQYLPRSAAYVIPFTLANFLLTGIATAYLLWKITEHMRAVFVGFQLVLAMVDLIIFVQFFNNYELSILGTRFLFVLISYIIHYFIVTKIAKNGTGK